VTKANDQPPNWVLLVERPLPRAGWSGRCRSTGIDLSQLRLELADEGRHGAFVVREGQVKAEVDADAQKRPAFVPVLNPAPRSRRHKGSRPGRSVRIRWVSERRWSNPAQRRSSPHL
jgi:hypothetical protein